MVEVSGQDNVRPRAMGLCVFAESQGQIIPAILPSIATQMILNQEIAFPGIIPLSDWLPRQRFMSELKKRHVRTAVKTDDSEAWLVSK